MARLQSKRSIEADLPHGASWDLALIVWRVGIGSIIAVMVISLIWRQKGMSIGIIVVTLPPVGRVTVRSTT